MATNTSASSTTHTGNGTAGPFSISFNYLDEDEIDVTVDGALKTLTTHYTFPSASTISFTSGNHPTNGAAIKFQRDTDISSKKVDFQDGSVLTEADLDNNTNQILYGLQEFVDLINDGVVRRDGTLPMTGDLQMDVGRSIIFEGATANAHETTLSVEDPTADRTVTLPNTTGTVVTTGDTGTVTSTMLANGTIVDTDINTGAEIAVSKLADGSARQLLQTNSGGTGVEWTSNIDIPGTLDVTGAATFDSSITGASLNISGNADVDGTLEADAYTINGTALNEYIADTVGEMVSSNTETNITVTYDDADNTLDFSVVNITGNAATATTLQNARTIGGVSFDGSANINLPGVNTAGNQNTTGSAATLTTARTIAGTSFDGSANIDISYANLTNKLSVGDGALTQNNFTNTLKTKLDGIDAGAEVNVQSDWNASSGDAQILNKPTIPSNLADLANVHTATPNDGQVLKWVNSNSRWEPAADLQGSLTDGDYGEITVSSSGSAFTIDNGVVTTAKIADDAITGAKLSDNLDIPDSNTIRFGTGNDLQIYHDGSNSYIKDAGTGNLLIDQSTANVLYLRSDDLRLSSYTGTETYIDCNVNGAVELYYDNSKKFETNSTGIDVTGDVHVGDSSGYGGSADNLFSCGASDDLKIYHHGSWGSSYINNSGSSALFLESDDIRFRKADGNDLYFKAVADGAVELYYDNSKRLETTSGGVTIPNTLTVSDGANFDGDVKFENNGGTTNAMFWDKSESALKFVDNTYLWIGSGNDIELWHDGTDSNIKSNTGQLKIRGSDIRIKSNDDGETMAVFSDDGACELNFNNVKKFETTSSGVWVTGSITTTANSTFEAITLNDNKKLYIGSSDDLQIYHNGTSNIILANSGDLNIRTNNEENSIVARQNGAAELYYDNSKKFETTSTGVTVSGNVDVGTNKFIAGSVELDQTGLHLEDADKIYCGTGNDLQIFHNGTSSQINDTGGSIYIQSDEVNIRSNTGGEMLFKGTVNGGVELYYDDSKKFETYSLGVNTNDSNIFINGDNGKFIAGAGSDLLIYHNGTDSFIENTSGKLYLKTTNFIDLRGDGNETMMKGTVDSSVELYYDNVLQMNTHANGIFTRGIYPITDDTFDIGSGSARYDDIYATNGTINTSDRNEKNTIIESDLGLNFVNKLKPVSYKWNKDDGKTHYGLIAQDVKETLSTEGKTDKDFAALNIPTKGPMGLNYSELISPLIKAVQELSAKVAALESA